jgi:hypothetical protein
MTSFFETGRIYAARAGWPGGYERFRFYCTEVTTDPRTGEPRAYGWHGRLRTADDAWIWTPNPRTFDDWNSGGTWTDITDEPEPEVNVYVNVDGEEFTDHGKYLDRYGDTWRFLGGILDFQHIKRADEDTPAAGSSIVRHCESAPLIVRDFGPMTKTA